MRVEDIVGQSANVVQGGEVTNVGARDASAGGGDGFDAFARGGDARGVAAVDDDSVAGGSEATRRVQTDAIRAARHESDATIVVGARPAGSAGREGRRACR